MEFLCISHLYFLILSNTFHSLGMTPGIDVDQIKLKTFCVIYLSIATFFIIITMVTESGLINLSW